MDTRVKPAYDADNRSSSFETRHCVTLPGMMPSCGAITRRTVRPGSFVARMSAAISGMPVMRNVPHVAALMRATAEGGSSHQHVPELPRIGRIDILRKQSRPIGQRRPV